MAQQPDPNAVRGLILIAPGAGAGEGLSELLAHANVQGVPGRLQALSNWDWATAEVYELTRAASKVLRVDRHAVVYLDVARESGNQIDPEVIDFASSRMSQIVPGLADRPDFVVIHGEPLGIAVLVEALGEESPTVRSSDRPSTVIYEAGASTMFSGLPIAIIAADVTINRVTEVVRELGGDFG